MNIKSKISIITSEENSLDLLYMFTSLAHLYDITVHTISDFMQHNASFLNVKLKLYPNIPDMPGYLRDVEKNIYDSDLIVMTSDYSLSSFQAMRISSKHNIPTICLSHKIDSTLFSQFNNIQAIQFDIHERATLFVATSEGAVQELQSKKVSHERIILQSPLVNPHQFKMDLTLREKFRRYIKISEKDFVVTFLGDLIPDNTPDELIKSLRHLLTNQFQEALQFRIIFAGTGQESDSLKYKAFDMGVGKSIMFLHQSTRPFLADLLSASDLVILPPTINNPLKEAFPMLGKFSLACGTPVVMKENSLFHTLTQSEDTITYLDFHHLALAQILKQVYKNSCRNPDMRQNLAKQFLQNEPYQEAHTIFTSLIDSLIRKNKEIYARGFDFDQAMKDIEKMLLDLKPQEALIACEDILLKEITSWEIKSDIFCLQGDAYYQLGQFEGAMKSYSESLKFENNSFKALRGLGYVSLQSQSHEEAITFFKKALAINTQDILTLVGIGMVHRKVGLLDEALYWFVKAVQIDCDHLSSISGLTYTCLELKDTRYAISILEKTTQVIGENKMIKMALDQLYVRTGQLPS